MYLKSISKTDILLKNILPKIRYDLSHIFLYLQGIDLLRYCLYKITINDKETKISHRLPNMDCW